MDATILRTVWIFAYDSCMAEVFIFRRLANPVAPAYLALDNLNSLVARVVTQVLE